MPIGTVSKIEDNYVFVTIDRQDMCGDCHACEVVTNPKKCEIKCQSDKNCKVGDTVKISLDDSRFIKSVLIMYGIPLISLFIGLAIGWGIANIFQFKANELWMIMGAIVMLAISYLSIHRIDYNKKYENMMPKILEIIEK